MKSSENLTYGKYYTMTLELSPWRTSKSRSFESVFSILIYLFLTCLYIYHYAKFCIVRYCSNYMLVSCSGSILFTSSFYFKELELCYLGTFSSQHKQYALSDFLITYFKIWKIHCTDNLFSLLVLLCKVEKHKLSRWIWEFFFFGCMWTTTSCVPFKYHV